MKTQPGSTPVRSLTTALAATASALSLTACGVLGGDNASAVSKKGSDITVGLLLPDRDTTRFEKFDRPLIEQRIASLTHAKGKVRYANAGGSVATQGKQFEQMIAAKVDVVLVDAVDAKAIASGVRKAKDAGIPVIAYDRLAEGPIDAYISHDNELVGEVQGRSSSKRSAARPRPARSS